MGQSVWFKVQPNFSFVWSSIRGTFVSITIFIINLKCISSFTILLHFLFVLRLANELHLSMSLKALYSAFVRPILEYGCFVYDPLIANNIWQIQKIRNKFLRFASYVLKMLLMLMCSLVANALGFPSLMERRRTTGIKFIEGLLNGKIDSNELVLRTCFKVPLKLTRYTQGWI